jgi:GTP-binding protein
MGNIIAIVGRPNVGKSTLFNRLTESRKAIVEETSGVTRDRHYGKVFWNGREFSVVDTGGYIKGSDDIFEDEIRKQVMIAVEEANIILFVVDVTVGATDLDNAVAEMLRKSDKKVIIVSNKVDNNERQLMSAEFYTFGLGDIYNVSAINGAGTGELLDYVVENLRPEEDAEEDDIPRIAVVGKPNVGKSSLTNALLGTDRNIVTPISGTTRDTINTRYNSYGFDFWLMDTAGIRKKTKIDEDIEFYSVLRSVRAIENSDVCLLLIDAQDGVLNQDQNIFSVIQKNYKGIVILVNKWDLIEKDNHTTIAYEEQVRKQFAPFTDLPVIFISALNKQRIHKALEKAIEVYHNRMRKIPTSKLNEVMLDVIAQNPPPGIKGKYIKIKYVTQLPSYSPAFAFFCNLPQYIKDPYKRYLENKLREHFDFTGVPLKIYFRKK